MEKDTANSKPPLYLIIEKDPEEDTDETKKDFMDEMIEFANKTKLPCHIVGHKVLFYSGNKETVYVHEKTEPETLEKLKSRGFTNLIKVGKDDEIKDFQQMTKEAAKGVDLLPVIISLRNGVMTSEEKANETAIIYNMPIISFENTTCDVSILWRTKDNAVINVEYDTDEDPWGIKTSSTKSNTFSNKIACISCIHDIDTLICKMIVSVCLEGVSSTEGQLVYYYVALSTYLLEKGDTKIHKQYIRKFFKNLDSEYMSEEVMSNENCSSELQDNLPEHRGGSNEVQTMSYETNGLLFFALMFNKCWDEALRMLENGSVGIHHILRGCLLLDDAINRWGTPIVVKEKLQRYKSAFTERTTSITSSIYQKFKERVKDDKKRKSGALKWTTICTKDEESTTEETEVDENINHAERLLLNQGLLRDAISTDNKAFLKDETVKNILNNKWYGTEEMNLLTMSIFIVLAAVHPFVLPILMINMERRPLLWLYKLYQLPFLKVFIQMLGFAVVIAVYAYMLLFNYSDDGITSTDYFIILWIVSFLVDEIKQIIVAIIREQTRNYIKDWWNILDWLFIIGYTFGMLFRAGEGSGFKTSSKCLLLAAFMLLCIRILHLCCMTEFLGPKLVIIRKMIKQTIAFMIIMAVIQGWYSVSFYSLLYPNSDFSWAQMENILSNGYWILFGELNLDSDTLTPPHCSFNKTLYESGVLTRCPSSLGLHLTPYLKAFYGLIAVILLLNLLIALYSESFNKVQQESESYWRKIQLDFVEEYCLKTIFPTHLQLLALPGTIVAVLWFWCSCLRKKFGNEKYGHAGLNSQPMVVRVFLYEANYDVKPESTYAAEKYGVNKAKGKIDLSSIDAISTKIQLGKIEDMTRMLMEKQQTMEQTMNTMNEKLEEVVLHQKRRSSTCDKL